MTAGEYRDLEQAQDPFAGEIDAPLPGEETRREKRRELTDAFEQQQRELAALDSRRQRLVLEYEIHAAELALAEGLAERDLAHARQDRLHFEEVESERRLREEALRLQEAQDDLLAVREELAQLELLYADASDDAAAELVLQRTRRNLARAEERHRLAQERHDDLRAIVLPRELAERVAGVERAELMLTNARRRAELGVLQSRAAEDELMREEQRLRQALDVLTEEQDALGDPRGLDS